MKSDALIPLWALLLSCQTESSSAPDPTSPNDETPAAPGEAPDADPTGFPAGLAVASPLGVQAQAPGPRSAEDAPYTTHYAWATGQIDQLLAGTLDPADAFVPETFVMQPHNAPCFGPSMHYHDHPDGPDNPPMGADSWPSLPSGDLGLWLETDPETGDACAAAQLTAQMDGVSGRSVMGLMGLASLVATATDAGVAMPEAGDEIDLTDAMNGLGIPNTTFSAAHVARDAEGAVWSYELGLTFEGRTTHDIVVALQHEPGADVGTYQGVLTWQVGDEFQGGHCPSAAVTYNGSLFYARSGADRVVLNARDGMYCGSGTAAATTVDAEVDPSETYDLVDPAEGFDGTSGWANGFSITGADFDPNTLAGSYTYAWQAGHQDSNARIFSVQLGLEDVTQALAGDAYYGFGDPIGSTDGAIHGFYCSWAAPGATRLLHASVQHQGVAFDPDSGRFDVPPDGSHITYAPTNACTHEGPSDFWYDRNLNRVDDEVPSDLEVVPDLMSPNPSDDLDGDGTPTLPEMMETQGFEQPAM